LLKFAKDRHRYRTRLREALQDNKTKLLSYNITSNHVHLLCWAETAVEVGRMMQQAAGESARDYNRRKRRTGAFWEGRYHATMVDAGSYLWSCLLYIDLNMVRCGRVSHPGQWEWSSHRELMGQRKRNKLLSADKLLELLGADSLGKFRSHYAQALLERIEKDNVKRESKWTECLAVGSNTFVNEIKSQMRNRASTEVRQTGDTWVLQEEHGSDSDYEKGPIGGFNATVIS